MHHGDSFPNSEDLPRHEPPEAAPIHIYDPSANLFSPLVAVYPEIHLYITDLGDGTQGCGEILPTTEFHLDPARGVRIKGMEGAAQAQGVLAARRTSSRAEPAPRNRIRPFLELTEPPPEPPPPPEPWR